MEIRTLVPKIDLERWGVLVWMLWSERNVLFMAIGRRADSVNASSSRSWSPSVHDYLKLNVNAVVSDTRNYFGVGAVIRDSMGLVCGAAAIILPGCYNILTTERLVIRTGTSFALQFDIPSF
ncbi:non-LTR retroelement reverse transcriptase [Parasponia andersonii]|uniref:Non-LTR retroelement reverse transcriptase n=1 Tax=Parasponia andersonii TaxID=3476 RepID=A0A2P5D1R8_PARAD|nr:non-LTR retroelement reverse transcriptase [Parasponia andersonii]